MNSDQLFNTKYSTLESFKERVLAVMENEGASLELSSKEEELILFGFTYKTGPMDTAYQLIDDRLESQEGDTWDDEGLS